ncbi:MAG TPA: ABC transporter permease [Solirubrobacteraceae bacterium]|nr:ABC transporter permease [Solirubrobacteraceae bacterium]
MRDLARRAGWLLPVLAIVLLLAIWQAYVDVSGVSRFVLPSPHEVLRALVDDRGTLWHNLKPTAAEILCGISLATLIGVLSAVVLHFSDLARRALYPPLVASQAVPIVILAPLLVVWLGFGLLPKLIVIALVCFFPIVVTTLSGLQTVDPDLIKLLRTFDSSRKQTFWRVELPSALPGLFAGAKLAAVFSVIGAVFAEQAGSTSGLGLLLNVTISNLETAEAFATVLVLAAFAILLFALLTLAERRALPWIHRQRETQPR